MRTAVHVTSSLRPTGPRAQPGPAAYQSAAPGSVACQRAAGSRSLLGWLSLALIPLVLLPALPAGTALADPPAVTDQQLDQTLQQLEIIIEKYDLAREQLKATRAQTAALDTQLTPLRTRVATLNTEVGRLASALYQGGSISTANAFVNTTSPEDLAEKLAIVDHLAHRNRRQIDALNAAKAGLETQKKALDASLQQQTRAEREIATKKAHIEQQLTAFTAARWGLGRLETRDSYVPPFKLGRGGAAVQYAYGAIGTPYVFGAEGPGAYDCSGLTMAAWRAAGVSLPHSAELQRQVTDPVPASELRPGDLVFYYPDVHHVGVYAGAGRVIHAPQPGQRITMAPMNQMPVHSFGRPRVRGASAG
ncbi:NlpC/P60 family protein [Longispora sp. NPDC051575]|uniref:C40 family peptidase n=1 Tax=Longispora sp. NPDC051575 TaxID=3154943 RepID=UPI00341D9842